MKAIKAENGFYRKFNESSQQLVDVYVYEVRGTKEELAAFVEAKGTWNRMKEGTDTPLYFSSIDYGASVELGISKKIKDNGQRNVYAVDTLAASARNVG